ncbi:MAG: hypothetical protein DSY46_07660 [Hydrogenimonas sp.]|nr:MAG: hypothetical protein DSY46_07660 [Hydrogenimonas sp.]
MKERTIKYLMEHKSGYIKELEDVISSDEIKEAELLGLLERGQDLNVNSTERVNTYKTTPMFDEFLFLTGKSKKRNLSVFKKVNYFLNNIFLKKGVFG